MRGGGEGVMNARLGDWSALKGYGTLVDRFCCQWGVKL